MNSPTNHFTGVTANADGSKTITFTGVPGYPYRLQAATNLISAGWTDISTNTVDDSGQSSFNDVNTSNWPQKYYRTVYP